MNATAPVLRRHRGSLVLVGLLLLATLVTAYVNRGRTYPTDDLHPENPAPNGARALAQVMADQGVDVTVADRQAELQDARVDARTTLLVTSAEELGASTARVLTELASAAGAVVLASPGPMLLEQAALPAEPSVAGPVRTGAECDDPLMAGLEVDLTGGIGYLPAEGAEEEAARGCFPTAGPGPRSSLVLRLGISPQTYLLGAPEVLQNAGVTTADHAAVGMRLLGQHDRLVWYHASVDDLTPTDASSAADLLPRWLGPGLLLVGVAAVASVFWRGRRLGPLVVEPLPVTVRSVETAESRGRLYRRVGDQQHAAAALRSATRHRLTARLGLPRGTPTSVLVQQLAQRTGRPPADLAGLLVGGHVGSDTALIRLVDELSDLESGLDLVTKGE